MVQAGSSAADSAPLVSASSPQQQLRAQQFTNDLLVRSEQSALWCRVPIFTSLFGVGFIAKIIGNSQDCTWDFCSAANLTTVVCWMVGTMGMINVLCNCGALHRVTRRHNTEQYRHRVN